MSDDGPRQFYWRGVRVPFIAPWSGEKQPRVPLVLRPSLLGGEIGYEGEHPRLDRRNGILWVRMPAVRGVGYPRLAKVHALRQRQAMAHMLCQVCGRSTYGREDGTHLFLMADRGGAPISEGETTAMPPIHESCAAEALQHCPHMSDGAVAAWVKDPLPWGVAGVEYNPITLAPIPTARKGQELTFAPYESPRVQWTIAARDVVSLHGCIPVDVKHLVALAV
ncbi:hypothetical protein [Streptomyces sp. NPDC006335]|uniref:hypothetical protein n=1 Tax=Streptomyces sp. NPDC006335 TaxID=3156895 RepID=UPI0033A1F52F